MRPADDRQWIETILAHHDAGATPYNFMLSPVALKRVEGHYGAPFDEKAALPIRMTGPKSIKPLYADPALFGSTARDEFGVIWSTNPIDRGSPIGPVLKDSSLDGYRFPDFSKAYRFEDIGAWCGNQAGHFRVVWVGDLWERATFMRGMEALLLDVALNPRFVEELLRGIADCILGTMQILFDRFQFEAIAVSDDYGTQRAMVISPAAWRKLMKPLLVEIYGFAKKRGRKVFHHSCGNIVPVIGDLIDIGLDILHPIQPEAMDSFFLKKEFGKHLTFCGGVSTQGLLVTGSPDEVRRAVRKLKETMGRDGGYILEPGITLQADVPLENMVAMMDEARVCE